MENISDTIRALRPHIPPEPLRDVVHVEIFLRAADMFEKRRAFFEVCGEMTAEVPGLGPEKSRELLGIVADAQRRWKDLVPGARHE